MTRRSHHHTTKSARDALCSTINPPWPAIEKSETPRFQQEDTANKTDAGASPNPPQNHTCCPNEKNKK